MLLLIIPIVSAVNIDSGTNVYSSGLNSTINFTSSFITDYFIVESNSIYFNNFRLSETEYISTNITNTGLTGSTPPYISASSSTSKTITSGLSQSVNATVIVNVAQCSFSANYNGGLVNEDSCNDNIATFTLNEIPGGSSILSLTYLDLACSTNTGASVIIILVFCALSIVALTFILVMNFKEGEFDVKILIIVFIAIVVGLVLFTQVAQLTGGVCS